MQHHERLQRVRALRSHQFAAQVVERLKADNQQVLTHSVLVPNHSKATWNLYYFCPDHGVRLDWRWDSPEIHRCPVDGALFTGEPYDGGWWRGLNGLNAKACHELALLWLLTDNVIYLQKVRELLQGYAEQYPDYQEHGVIPYNGPGKANAQTLCEANCHLDFAQGYDYIRTALSAEEQQTIEQRLLREGAEFLMAHRGEQLHNHEVKIGATIGIIGFILQDSRYLEFALAGKYGLKGQLQRGVLAEGLWFEGSIHYHYYALQAFLQFEKWACDTPYSLAAEPNLAKMLAFPLRVLDSSGRFPRINDCIAGQEWLTHNHLYEFAYRQYREPAYAQALQTIYRQKPRNDLDALLYGCEPLPAADDQPLAAEVHAPVAGLTLYRDLQHGHQLLVKHSPYGGEHDHYDRLSISLMRAGVDLLPDLGTTGYGAELHYGYYKNSSTHNTLVIDQSNQPPAIPQLLSRQGGDGFNLLDVKVDWSQPYPGLDSYTRVQWDQQAYQDVVFRRILLWLDQAAVEIDLVHNPHQRQMDLVWLVRGELARPEAIWQPLDNPITTGALARIHHCMGLPLAAKPTPSERLHYNVNAAAPFRQWIFGEGELLSGRAPDNPATQDLSCLLLRSRAIQGRTLMLHDLSVNRPIEEVNVEWQHNTLSLTWMRDGVTKSLVLEITETQSHAGWC
ncbi:heparinase II/III family protein [Serratia sp. DD3]|uniref:heparinase II/III domain-containing protein n=1 Tax=Serratia sp. DD3 TaxID=1410619 RepID=UPI0003C4E8F9|nr:heparinase II/III family protein [Serratia sp. DD3]KEY59837.1 heparinase II/III-like protein [Serratia sp. DD3]